MLSRLAVPALVTSLLVAGPTLAAQDRPTPDPTSDEATQRTVKAAVQIEAAAEANRAKPSGSASTRII